MSYGGYSRNTFFAEIRTWLVRVRAGTCSPCSIRNGDWQDLIAIAVEIISHRAQNDAAAIGWDRSPSSRLRRHGRCGGALAYNDAITGAPGGFNRRFGCEGGGVIERRDKHFALGLSAEKFGENALGANRMAGAVQSFGETLGSSCCTPSVTP